MWSMSTEPDRTYTNRRLRGGGEVRRETSRSPDPVDSLPLPSPRPSRGVLVRVESSPYRHDRLPDTMGLRLRPRRVPVSENEERREVSERLVIRHVMEKGDFSFLLYPSVDEKGEVGSET